MRWCHFPGCRHWFPGSDNRRETTAGGGKFPGPRVVTDQWDLTPRHLTHSNRTQDYEQNARHPTCEHHPEHCRASGNGCCDHGTQAKTRHSGA